MIKPPFGSFGDVRGAWKTLTAYERFEVTVALLLRAVIGVIIVIALYRLLANVAGTILLGALNPLDHVVFQPVAPRSDPAEGMTPFGSRVASRCLRPTGDAIGRQLGRTRISRVRRMGTILEIRSQGDFT